MLLHIDKTTGSKYWRLQTMLLHIVKTTGSKYWRL